MNLVGHHTGAETYFLSINFITKVKMILQGSFYTFLDPLGSFLFNIHILMNFSANLIFGHKLLFCPSVGLKFVVAFGQLQPQSNYCVGKKSPIGTLLQKRSHQVINRA